MKTSLFGNWMNFNWKSDRDNWSDASKTKSKNSFFKRVKYFEKPDLIKPTLYWRDETHLNRMIKEVFNTNNGIDNIIKPALTIALQNKDPKINAILSKNSFEFISNMLKKLPEHIVYDVFKLYFSKIEKLKFEDRTKDNEAQYQMVESCNDSVNKIMTEGSLLKSGLFTRNAIIKLVIQMAILDAEENGSANSMKKMLEGEKLKDEEKAEELLKKMEKLEEEFKESGLDNFLKQQALETSKIVENVLDDNAQDDLFYNKFTGGTLSTGSINKDMISNLVTEITKMQINVGTLKNKIQKLLDRSMSYFQKDSETQYEDILNTSDVGNLDDFVLLHPNIRKIMIEDVLIPTKTTKGKIDVYLDISGSMNEESGVKQNGVYLSKIDFSKAIVAKLIALNMVRKLYFFDDCVKETSKPSYVNLALAFPTGGTTLNACVEHIENQKQNAIVITDAEDTDFNIYSDKAFFLGLLGSDFNYVDKTTRDKYSKGGQLVIFDGNTIKEC